MSNGNQQINDREQFTVTLPSNVVAQIDAHVGTEFTDREDFVRAAVRYYLDFEQDKIRKNQQVV